jgi:hypothetical protein
MSQRGEKNVTKTKKVTTEEYFQQSDKTIQALWDNSVPGVTL